MKYYVQYIIYNTNITNNKEFTNKMSSNKFDALGSDDSEADEGINNHQQLEVLVVNLDS